MAHDHAKAQREWRARNPLKVVQIARAEDPYKRRARKIVQKAVKRGALTKPGACEECGFACNPDAHHENYSEPYVFKWLCRICHGKRHRGSNRKVGI